jgi:peroxiredoxin
MRSIHKLFSTVALACLCATVVVPPNAEARVGARPPAFSLPSIPGGPVPGTFRLAEHLGNSPVVIIFWASWCDPCKQQMPIYQDLYERYREQGLKVVAISMDGPESVARTGPITSRLGLTYPVVSDLDTSVTARLNPRRGAPFTVWIDRSGRIVYEREGFTLAEGDDIRRGIGALMRR